MGFSQRLTLSALLVLLCAGVCLAGDIMGTVAAPHPEKVLVFIDGVKGTFSPTNAVIDQKSKLFVPYVVPVLKGSKVTFANEDDLAHNVMGVGADEFNLGAFGKGATRDHTFSKSGDVTLLCNIHPEMEGHILVLDNPFYARPDGGGKFSISNVPAGDYVVKAWYAGKVKKQNVKIPATGSVTITF